MFRTLLGNIAFYIVMMILIFVPVSISTANIDTRLILPIKKIAIVNSYDIEHVTGTPQTQGIVDHLLESLGGKYQFDFQVWYMKTNTIYDNQEKVNYISNKIMMDINSFSPDYIFTIDDAAFKNIGIPLSLSYKVYFSGINKPFGTYDLENPIYGVEEQIEINGLCRYFNLCDFYPYKVWIISDMSTVSHYLTQNYVNELKRNKLMVEVIHISKISELLKTISDLQDEKKGVILYTFQNLKDEDYGGYRTKKQLIKDMLKYNKKHLELCENDHYAKMGISFVVGSDFYYMGKQVGMIFEQQKSEVIKSKTIISINIKRLEELGFNWMYREIIREVDNSYASY